MTGNGPRYDRAAEASAEIINLHLYVDLPTPQVYARILYTILAAMYAADSDLAERRHRPSDN